MDVDQRKYLIERIKQEYNNTIVPFKTNSKKFTVPNPYTYEEMVKMVKEGDLSKVLNFSAYPYASSCLTVSFKREELDTKPVDYTALLEKLTTEKNKVLDQIMLGDIPNASEILSKFLNFLATEKAKFNVN